jgi:hypothetical protein
MLFRHFYFGIMMPTRRLDRSEARAERRDSVREGRARVDAGQAELLCRGAHDLALRG